MQDIVWRNGLAGATGPERLAILDAEHKARQLALQQWAWERVLANDGVVAGARAIDVRGASTFWGRKEGRLYLRITVYGRSAGRIRSFLWHTTVRTSPRHKRVKLVQRTIDDELAGQ